ncbi:unnamed protein product [Lepeophtheirus salmonis]|uniref:(salmon louse) hypothetical protein n=1 Tax=Lepeophtheirus salmonis TaxID=72036 RepID=A0A7R8CZE6_LEPSM|nr:unnamed protein product [Lepeophtheirus salmonis]CAF2974734.1 unnamed protein product [Lepeophtheirus salmonis]
MKVTEISKAMGMSQKVNLCNQKSFEERGKKKVSKKERIWEEEVIQSIGLFMRNWGGNQGPEERSTSSKTQRIKNAHEIKTTPKHAQASHLTRPDPIRLPHLGTV